MFTVVVVIVVVVVVTVVVLSSNRNFLSVEWLFPVNQHVTLLWLLVVVIYVCIPFTSYFVSTLISH